MKFANNGGMSWFPAPFKFLDLLKTAESFVSEQRKNEAAKLEEERVARELKEKQEAEARIAAEAAAKVAANAALLARKKSQDLAKKRFLGKTCAKLKSVKNVSGIKFTCVKRGKKLVWALK